MIIAGVILAGGQSSRFGRHKMFEVFQGLPLYHHSLNALRQNNLCPIIIATNDALFPSFPPHSDVTWLIETPSHQGPLFALHQLFIENPDIEWFFVIASDMPYMSADFVKLLLQKIDSCYDAVIPQQSARIQPLAALYRRSALATTTKLVANNHRSMKALLAEIRVHYVDFSVNDNVFTNINYETDWPKGDK
ncbi:molybdenum cofactor guanylyltransferase [Kurthia sibirica]|uniref:Probable molybdenum cofactor guanylyltransferase n=1 Tax=Kurthia sibirica TaxID=202750 RepID=A0A2U3AKS0_9BACL|nr:molybdenum cofactor guanylyltransferase [Kurthia sibirica]PWI25119.1 molybdenum cofactor guanylyltransferase [Kurthia sibirica]GEK34041.1 putative molybdenum cofactor guanylyltransferase [Kurthia sibirica]